ncbi:MAG: hypothetical protein ACM3VS_18865 [Candidatus Dadabacteria bacterium]
MKKLTSLLLLLLSISILSFSQETSKPINRAYLQFGTGGCSHSGSSGYIGMQLLFKNNWVTSFSYQGVDMDPKNIPADYQPPKSTIIFIPFEDNPRVSNNLFSLTGGKYFKTGRNTWFSTEAGLSIMNGEEITFTRNPGAGSGWTIIILGEEPSNYNTTVVRKNSFGGVAKADFNWAFASFAGLGAGVFTNINSIQSVVGLEVKLSVGWMNHKKHS